MTVKIRHGFFETNSSSTHSFTVRRMSSEIEIPGLSREKRALINRIEGNDAIPDKTLTPDADGRLHINCGDKEFGWGYDEHNDAATKATYCYIDNHQSAVRVAMLKAVIMEYTGAKEVTFGYDPEANYDDRDYGYIDHQSQGNTDKVFTDVDTLRSFIFNQRSILVIDNDNH